MQFNDVEPRPDQWNANDFRGARAEWLRNRECRGDVSCSEYRDLSRVFVPLLFAFALRIGGVFEFAGGIVGGFNVD